MKKLSEFVSLLSPQDVLNFQDMPIKGIGCCPQDLNAGSLYCVVDEFLEYGHWMEGMTLLKSLRPDTDFKTWAALLLESPIPDIPLPQLIVSHARKSMALAAKYFFDTPDEQIRIVGVTGTNGKTTTTHLISRLLTACGKKSAALGTLGLYTGNEKYEETVYTTSLSPTLFETLNRLRQIGITHLAAEISSHALKLDRVFGLDTDVAVFTNMARDHLDFHGTIADYRASKTKLFTRLKSHAVAVLNVDDTMGKELVSLSPCPVFTYGCSPDADLRARDIRYRPAGTSFQVSYQGRTMEINTLLVGDFNVSNVLAALAACLAMRTEPEALEAEGQNLSGVAGRLEMIPLPGDRVGIADYAHTPDSMEKVLEALRTTGAKRILTVFGCGGDRDRGKRPIMGQVADRLSDLCIVTSDNPRREDPQQIIADILAGMPENTLVEPDRRKAIRMAFEISRAGDVILVAGKGHEPYQIIIDEKFPFDDREELRALELI
ncbi:MAG: UDP-N-acetylmuramoyl-L-alanyl-D-glutamate--2,6-diaminopimelate ligase [Desulfobacteraceae bacterium 4572_88]|nr:MAG: UDP-N-acetylmuramoyl-L-alanyl-D-glutamate--2,6-diaminopimelate ligase [Desulfobacteraceae bacterium 4572_88]